MTARVGSIASCSMHGGRGRHAARGAGPIRVGDFAGLGIYGLWGVYGLGALLTRGSGWDGAGSTHAVSLRAVSMGLGVVDDRARRGFASAGSMLP